MTPWPAIEVRAAQIDIVLTVVFLFTPLLPKASTMPPIKGVLWNYFLAGKTKLLKVFYSCFLTLLHLWNHSLLPYWSSNRSCCSISCPSLLQYLSMKYPRTNSLTPLPSRFAVLNSSPPLLSITWNSHKTSGQWDNINTGQYSLNLNQWNLSDAYYGSDCAAITSLNLR